VKLARIVSGVENFIGKFVHSPVKMRPISSWQEKQCINIGNHQDCTRKATREASYKEGKHHAAVRCCTNPACQDEARKIAKEALKGKTQS